MNSKTVFTLAIGLVAATVVFAQQQARPLPPAPANAPTPSLQTAADPGYAALTAKCKTPPPARGARGGGGAGARGAAGGRGPAAPAGPREYTVTEIPGVIAAGQQWKFV